MFALVSKILCVRVCELPSFIFNFAMSIQQILCNLLTKSRPWQLGQMWQNCREADRKSETDGCQPWITLYYKGTIAIEKVLLNAGLRMKMPHLTYQLNCTMCHLNFLFSLLITRHMWETKILFCICCGSYWMFLRIWHIMFFWTGTSAHSGNRIFNIMRFIEDVQKALLQEKKKSGGDEDID